MSFIRWAGLDPATVERAIKALILELHPGVRPIDGAGGDGGRDVRWDSPDGLVIFEIKSYADRLKPTQKSKIKKSLGNAVAHCPIRWVLVLPLDHSPSEEKWFDDLQRDHPDIILDWLGSSWLDLEFGKREHLRRMVEGDGYELLRRSREFEKEEAVLAGGMVDVIARLTRLRSRADELSLYWVADIASDGGRVHVRYRERYPGAARLDPITPRPVFLFPPEEPDAVETERLLNDFYDYGGDVEVDGKYVTEFRVDVSEESRALFALFTEGPTVSLRLTSQSQVPDGPPTMQLVATDATGRPKLRLPLRTDPPTEGARGVRVRGHEATGRIQVTLTMDKPELGGAYQVDIAFKGIAGELPYVARPAFDIFTHLDQDGDNLDLRINDQPIQFADELPLPVAEVRVVATTLAALEQLQAHTGTLFPVPDDLTYQDACDLKFAAKLLTGEPVRAANTSISMTIRHDRIEEFLASEAGRTPGALTAEFDGYALSLGPHQLSVGMIHVIAPRMALSNVSELQAAIGSGIEPTARYECIDGEGIYYRLGPLIREPKTNDE